MNSMPLSPVEIHATVDQYDGPSQQCNIYSPLDETKKQIRLMRVLATGEADTECELAPFSLQDEPDYLALSYAWTKAEPTCQIFLNKVRFHVRPNLYDFLVQLKAEQDDRWIFVDAVSINQGDLEERSSQVQLMGDVYRNAQEVHAWLGNFGPAVTDEVKQVYKSDTTLRALFKDASSEPAALRDAVFMASFHVVARPQYWSRLWVIQEMLLARVLIFRWRDISVSLDTLQMIIHEWINAPGLERLRDGRMLYALLRYLYSYPDNAKEEEARPACVMLANVILTQMCRIRTFPRPALKPPLLWTDVTVFFTQHCTIEHDKVFGFLGLIETLIRVDYQMNKLELFQRVFIEGFFSFMLELLESNQTRSGMGYDAFDQFISSLFTTLLHALGLTVDHPAVWLSSRRILELFDFDRALRHSLIKALAFEEFILFDSHPANSKRPTRSLHVRRILRKVPSMVTWKVRWKCRRVKMRTILPSCDGSEPKSYGTLISEVDSIFAEIASNMTPTPKGQALQRNIMDELRVFNRHLAQIDSSSRGF